MLEWTTDNGILSRHEKTSFGRHDSISVPAGKAAILSRDGDFSEVYREGDEPTLGSGLLPKKGELYMIDMKPTEAVSWGFGGVQCGDRVCGINGSLRFRVVSPRKFLTAYGSQPLPLTAENLASLWIQRLGDEVRKAAMASGSARTADAEIPGQVAESVSAALSEDLEKKGLSLDELSVEPLFFPDSEETEE